MARPGNPRIVEDGKPYRFKLGDKPNPRGPLPKMKTLAKLLRDQLEEPAYMIPVVEKRCEKLGMDPKTTTVGAVMVLCNIVDGMYGNANIVKEIWQRVDGVVTFTAGPPTDDHTESLTLDELEVRVKRALLRKPNTHTDDDE